DVADAATVVRDVLDRQTPRRTMGSFLNEARDGDWGVAANYLDLRSIPEALRAKSGSSLAQKLGYVLLHQRRLDLTGLPDRPEGDADAQPQSTVVAGVLYAGEDPVTIALDRVRFPDGVDRWLIARTTVAAIPSLDAAFGPRPIGVPIPSSLTRPTFLGNQAWQWIGAVLSVLLAYAIARVGAALVVRIGAYVARARHAQTDEKLVESARRPLRMVLGAVVFRVLLEPLQLTASIFEIGQHASYTLLVIGVAWLVLRALGVATTLWIDRQARVDGDFIRARELRTQTVILRRVASLMIGFVAGAFVLIQFEVVRSVGVSLLASAGVVSVVAGFAAQKSLAAIIGGIQFSFAPPVRMGDQVVVEGEFGEIEAIFLTYAVVRIWDKRRLVVPVTYFLEKPFQNWTRSGTDLLGAVLIKVDYGSPTEPFRAELERICRADPRWDKLTCGLQVTDSDGTTATLRALVSAANASNLFDLRCNVRERLLEFLRTYEGGKYLPRVRSESVGPVVAG
ncbi:MAG: mechanosensitive ion channel family protein, partial [Polyangiaceae bacterium]|nr:mechanosensitive ion channel family protein [Polyangiaceae bacterium]